MVTEEKKRQENVSPHPQVLLGYPRVLLLFCHVTLPSDRYVFAVFGHQCFDAPAPSVLDCF